MVLQRPLRDLVTALLAVLVLLALQGASTPGAAASGSPPLAESAPPAVACTGDGTSGHRVQLMYVHPIGADRLSAFEKRIRQAAWETQQDVDDSARRGDGSRRAIRYAHGGDCQVTIENIAVPPGTTADESFFAQVQRTHHAPDRIYAILADGWPGCGFMTDAGSGADDRPGTGNKYNQVPVWLVIGAGCWNSHVLTHEFAHALGGVNLDAPDSDGSWHCTDGQDALCEDTDVLRCPDPLSVRLLDCGDDDYFSTAPAGAYLPTHFNAAFDSLYLDHPAGTSPLEQLLPLPPQFLRVDRVLGGKVSLSFLRPGVTRGVSRFDILDDDQVIASVAATSTSAVVTGLAGDTDHHLSIRSRTSDGRVSFASPQVAVRTTSEGNQAQLPYDAKNVTLHNGFTDGERYMALDVGQASTAPGAVAVQWPLVGGSPNQQWTVDQLVDGTVLLQNARSGLCLAADGWSGDAALVQAECETWAANQRWWLDTDDTASSSAVAPADRTADQAGAELGVIRLRSVGTNRCAQPFQHSSDWYAPIVLGACSQGEPSQTWTAALGD